MEVEDIEPWLDPDFGWMTKERAKQLKELYEYHKTLIGQYAKGLGKIMVFGTGTGEDKTFEHFKDMFYNPSSYNILNFNEEQDQNRFIIAEGDNMKTPDPKEFLPKEQDFTNELMKLKQRGVDDNEKFVTSKDVENIEEEFKEITKDIKQCQKK